MFVKKRVRGTPPTLVGDAEVRDQWDRSRICFTTLGLLFPSMGGTCAIMITEGI
jgi:hypothetical protein